MLKLASKLQACESTENDNWKIYVNYLIVFLFICKEGIVGVENNLHLTQVDQWGKLVWTT